MNLEPEPKNWKEGVHCDHCHFIGALDWDRNGKPWFVDHGAGSCPFQPLRVRIEQRLQDININTSKPGFVFNQGRVLGVNREIETQWGLKTFGVQRTERQYRSNTLIDADMEDRADQQINAASTFDSLSGAQRQQFIDAFAAAETDTEQAQGEQKSE